MGRRVLAVKMVRATAGTGDDLRGHQYKRRFAQTFALQVCKCSLLPNLGDEDDACPTVSETAIYWRPGGWYYLSWCMACKSAK